MCYALQDKRRHVLKKCHYPFFSNFLGGGPRRPWARGWCVRPGCCAPRTTRRAGRSAAPGEPGGGAATASRAPPRDSATASRLSKVVHVLCLVRQTATRLNKMTLPTFSNFFGGGPHFLGRNLPWVEIAQRLRRLRRAPPMDKTTDQRGKAWYF